MNSKNIKNTIIAAAEGITSILGTPEIANLLESSQEFEVEISKPICHNYDISTDYVDLMANDQSILKNHDISKVHVREYHEDILNGIHRQIDKKNNYESCYEYRIFTVCVNNLYIITIKNRCSAELIPMIVDYDYSQDVKIETYEVGNSNAKINKISTKYVRLEICSTIKSSALENDNVIVMHLNDMEKISDLLGEM